MLAYVVDAARKAGSSEIIAVSGHQADLVRESVKDVTFVLQEEQLGTGHAVMQARHLLEGKVGTVLVVCGDTPLITARTLKQAYETHLKIRTMLLSSLPVSVIPLATEGLSGAGTEGLVP